MNFRDCCLLTILLLPSAGASAGDVTVAVASNFATPMNAIATVFETETGHQVKPAFSASGKFYAQIRNGAPFDVFLSADENTPTKLEQYGLAVTGSRFTYAIGALALWSAGPDFVNRQAVALKELRFNKLAIANPKLAPYGVAAIEVLQRLGIAEAVQSTLIQGQNIAQTHQFVDSGNADLGFVAVSQIMVQGKIKKGSVWIVPADLYSPIRQDATLLRAGANSEAARALLRFLRSEQARTIIHSYGYRTESD